VLQERLVIAAAWVGAKRECLRRRKPNRGIGRAEGGLQLHLLGRLRSHDDDSARVLQSRAPRVRLNERASAHEIEGVCLFGKCDRSTAAGAPPLQPRAVAADRR
jgi:hypothetical protein